MVKETICNVNDFTHFKIKLQSNETRLQSNETRLQKNVIYISRNVHVHITILFPNEEWWTLSMDTYVVDTDYVLEDNYIVYSVR